MGCGVRYFKKKVTVMLKKITLAESPVVINN